VNRNALSEIMKPAPDSNVLAWVDSIPTAQTASVEDFDRNGATFMNPWADAGFVDDGRPTYVVHDE